MSKRIVVVGGGASGMVAGIVAARNGANVMIIEQKPELGKKILATGNGRCNYTNLELSSECYYCNDNGFISHVIDNYPTQKILDFFESIGILPKDKDGYIYPFSEQASAIRNALEQELIHLGVKIITDTAVESIKNHEVKTWNKAYVCDAVILATGGASGLPKNTQYIGYDLLKDTKHKVTTLSPALVALKGAGKFYKKIAGIRTNAAVSALVDGVQIRTEIGELQLTDYGISGIPVFQISRIVTQALAKKKKDVIVKIDFMPQVSKSDLLDLLNKRRDTLHHRTMNELCNGLWKDKLIDFLLSTAGISGNEKALDVKYEYWVKFVNICKEFEVKILDSNPFAQSQVTAGGVPVTEVSENMESKFHNHLYLTGEVLDVDGICGGYNLHFAWATGIIAGEAASK